MRVRCEVCGCLLPDIPPYGEQYDQMVVKGLCEVHTRMTPSARVLLKAQRMARENENANDSLHD